MEAFGAVDHLTPCSHLLSPGSTPFPLQSIASPFIALDFSAPGQRAWIAVLWNAQLPACPELHEVGLDPLYCCLHAQKEGFLYFFVCLIFSFAVFNHKRSDGSHFIQQHARRQLRVSPITPTMPITLMTLCQAKPKLMKVKD